MDVKKNRGHRSNVKTLLQMIMEHDFGILLRYSVYKWACFCNATLLCFLIVACQSGENVYSDDVRTFNPGKADTIHCDAGYGMPYGFNNVFVVDTFIVYQTSQENKVFQVYSGDSPTATFGTKGKGPGEFMGDVYDGRYPYAGDTVFLWFHNPMKKEVRVINFTESIKTGMPRIVKSLKIPMVAIQVIPISDSTLFILSANDLDNSIDGVLFNFNSSEQTVYQLYKKLYVDALKFCGSFWGYNERMGRLVTSMAAVNQINFLELNTDRKYAYTCGNKGVNTVSAINKMSAEDAPYYYGRVATNDRHIYAFNAQQRKIYVFDWENGVEKTLFVEENISGIRVSPDDGYLYGFDYETEKMYRYPLVRRKKGCCIGT